MSETHGSIRPPSAAPDAQMHLLHTANAERRHVSAFWAEYDVAPESPSRWSDAAAAYWRSAATTPAGGDQHESMYR